MSFNKDKVNKVVFPASSSANVRRYPGIASSYNGEANVLFTGKADQPLGRTSGTFFMMKDGNWWQINLDKTYAGRNYGYVREDIIKMENPVNNTVATENAEKLMAAIQKSDIEVNKNLVSAASLLTAAEKQKKNVAALRTKFESIQKQYNARQTEIQNSGLVKVEKWTKDNMNKFATLASQYGQLSYGGMMGTNSVGAVPIIVVACVFVAGIASSAALYYWLRPKYSESAVDLKSSAELTKALAALTPDEATKLKNDLEGQIDDAYNQGKKNQWFSDMGGAAKTGIIVVLAFVGAKMLMNNFSPQTKKA